MRTQLPFAVLAAAFACSLATTPANARARVFVASYGNDSNPCTFGSPCKTFQQAVNVVDAGGEVTAIDSAGFGPIFIKHAVTITSPPGVEAGIVPSGNNTAIIVDTTAPTDAIVLRGLTLNGSGIGTTGINFIYGKSLVVENCVISNFSGSGIALSPDVPAPVSLVVTNTIVADNGGHGIYVQPDANTTVVHATFNRVQAYNNGDRGIGVYGNFMFNPAGLSAIIIDSVAANNGVNYYALGNGGPNTVLRVFRSVSFGATINGFHDIVAEGGAAITVSQSNLEDGSWGNSLVSSYNDNYTGGVGTGGSIINKE